MDDAGGEILIAIEGRAAIARLNRPKALNAVTPGMIRALSALYHARAKDPNLYGFVMEAEGRAFSAGGDIRAIRELIQTDLRLRTGSTLRNTSTIGCCNACASPMSR
jgi:enoyl-CoA hydratase